MSKTICGIDCTQCDYKDTCADCAVTNGRPFGSDCMIAKCCRSKGQNHCEACADKSCNLKAQLIAEFNTLGIADMKQVTDLCALKGSFVNLEYTLPSGQKIKLWDDNKIYLGYQVCKKDSDRCYGLTADENNLLVCEYGDNGTNPEIIVYKKRG